MKKIISISGLVGGLLFAPIFVFADTSANLQALIASLVGVVNDLIVLLIGMAVLVFMWGIVRFILKANEPQAREDGKKLMLFGIIAITVMICVWGLVGFLKNTFFPGNISTPLSSSTG